MEGATGRLPANGQRGAAPEAAAITAQVAAQGVEPPRVCLARTERVDNPVASYTTQVPSCGRATRAHIDAVTRDADLVTCPECQKLAGVPPTGAESAPAARPTSAALLQPESGGGAKALLESLDSGALAGRLADAEGEVRALKILLRAARAREKAKPRKGEVKVVQD